MTGSPDQLDAGGRRRLATGDRLRVGVISDTHGLLRAEAVVVLDGSHAIVHAGDVGSADILQALGRLAPVTAVRGNMDFGTWARSLPEATVLEIGGARLYVVHDVQKLLVDPRSFGFAAVIFGHSHRSSSELRDGVLFFNPGTAGPAPARQPVSVGRLVISRDGVAGEIVRLRGV